MLLNWSVKAAVMVFRSAVSGRAETDAGATVADSNRTADAPMVPITLKPRIQLLRALVATSYRTNSCPYRESHASRWATSTFSPARFDGMPPDRKGPIPFGMGPANPQ